MDDEKSKVTDKASEIAKNIWLAGLGAYGKAVEDAQGRLEKALEPPKLFGDLVRAGTALEEEAKGSKRRGGAHRRPPERKGAGRGRGTHRTHARQRSALRRREERRRRGHGGDQESDGEAGHGGRFGVELEL